MNSNNCFMRCGDVSPQAFRDPHTRLGCPALILGTQAGNSGFCPLRPHPLLTAPKRCASLHPSILPDTPPFGASKISTEQFLNVSGHQTHLTNEFKCRLLGPSRSEAGPGKCMLNKLPYQWEWVVRGYTQRKPGLVGT